MTYLFRALKFTFVGRVCMLRCVFLFVSAKESIAVCVLSLHLGTESKSGGEGGPFGAAVYGNYLLHCAANVLKQYLAQNPLPPPHPTKHNPSGREAVCPPCPTVPMSVSPYVRMPNCPTVRLCVLCGTNKTGKYLHKH